MAIGCFLRQLVICMVCFLCFGGALAAVDAVDFANFIVALQLGFDKTEGYAYHRVVQFRFRAFEPVTEDGPHKRTELGVGEVPCAGHDIRK